MSAEMKIGFAELYACLLPLYIGHLLKFAKMVQENNERFKDDKEIRLAIIGRTNVGKSTMFNQLLGKERVMVSDVPGTTRDTIQIRCLYKDQAILLADTAGMRKDKYLTNKIERESNKDTLRTIQYSNVVILVVDAQQPLTNDDLQIARMTEEEGRCLVIAANKWDLVTSPYDIAHQIEEKVTSSLAQVRGVKVVVCSALHGKNIELLIQTAVDAHAKWNTRISTGQLNRFLAKFTKTLTFQPSELPKIHYMTQVETRPPTFALWFTKASDIPKAFERQLVNALREEYDLDGVPFRILHKRKQGYEAYQKSRVEKIEEMGIAKNEDEKIKKDENRKKSGLPPKNPKLGKRSSKRKSAKPKRHPAKKSRRYKFLSH
jgi:GTP-binding protein